MNIEGALKHLQTAPCFELSRKIRDKERRGRKRERERETRRESDRERVLVSLSLSLLVSLSLFPLCPCLSVTLSPLGLSDLALHKLF